MTHADILRLRSAAETVIFPLPNERILELAHLDAQRPTVATEDGLITITFADGSTYVLLED